MSLLVLHSIPHDLSYELLLYILNINIMLAVIGDHPILHLFAYLEHIDRLFLIHLHRWSSWKIIHCWGYICMLILVKINGYSLCRRVDRPWIGINSSHRLLHLLILILILLIIYQIFHSIACIIEWVWKNLLYPFSFSFFWIVTSIFYVLLDALTLISFYLFYDPF